MILRTPEDVVALVEHNLRLYEDEVAYLTDLHARIPHYAGMAREVEQKAMALRELLECVAQEGMERDL